MSAATHPITGDVAKHAIPESVLRQRKGHVSTTSTDGYPADDEYEDEKSHKQSLDEEVTWGKTPSGQVFRVPETHSFVHTLLHTFHRSSLTRWTTISLVAQPILFFLLHNYPKTRSAFFLVYFIFWRAFYDFGFAYVLRRQSETKWIVRTLRQWGWLDVDSTTGGEEGREWAKWWKGELEMKMGKGYSWDNVPHEYNSWLIFRQLVDIVLLNDFTSYSLFAWSSLNWPAGQGIILHTLRWILGWALIVFNLWVKMDAHRVVKDYAWYWGDAFWLMVMKHDLVFDGVYEIAPHPMYSIGYAGYYGLSIVVGSYNVLFVSLAAHAAQFAFLLWFENPHIERTYGGEKKPLAARIPLDLEAASTQEAALEQELEPELTTPAATEGETETEPELSEPSEDYDAFNQHGAAAFARRQSARGVSLHDITHRFFRRPTVIFANFDPFRSTDFALAVLVAYAVISLVPALPTNLGLAAHFLHALSWRLFHSFGLGLVLRAQSKTKWLVRHYLNNYPYPGEAGNDDVDEQGSADKSVVLRATEEAFHNWQVSYNISLVMTHISFAGLAWKTYHLPEDWTVSGTILRHVLGFALISLHLWSALSSFEALGEFSWFYSDFFLSDQVPARLAYSGIFRFLNNPERTLGGAAFLGLALISNSRLVLALAIVSHLSHWWFLSFVEEPHMKRIYGDRLRKDGGLTKTVKSMTAKTLGRRKSVVEIKRYVDEVRESLEKVETKVTNAVGDFIEQAGPRLSEFALSTKHVIEQSRQHMHITRVAKDADQLDRSRYSITIASSSSSSAVPRFHVGQPIRVSWTAPSTHSRKDWIGIYRVGSTKSDLITKISSVGKWVPIFEEEFHGEDQAVVPPQEQISQGDAGIVTFRGKRLPWAPGQYELRYHHDGKHNVMSIIRPIEIYVNKPQQSQTVNYRNVHDSVMNIVVHALEANPALVPRHAKLLAAAVNDPTMPRPRAVSSSRRRGSASRQSGTMSPRSSISRFVDARSGSGYSTPNRVDRADSVGTASPRSSAADVGELTGIAELAEELRIHPSSPEVGPSPTLPNHPQSLGLVFDEAPGAGTGATTNGSNGGGVTSAPATASGDAEPISNIPSLADSDDFVIMDDTQVKRITRMIQQTYDVELSPEVVIADANVGALARRVLGARHLSEGSTESATASAVQSGANTPALRASVATESGAGSSA